MITLCCTYDHSLLQFDCIAERFMNGRLNAQQIAYCTGFSSQNQQSLSEYKKGQSLADFEFNQTHSKHCKSRKVPRSTKGQNRLV